MTGTRNVLGGPTLLPTHSSAVELASNVADRTRVLIGVVTVSKRLSSIEFRIRLDTVEVWYREHCKAVFDRDMLREWLGTPWRWLADDEVLFSVDPRSRGERIAISLDDGDDWSMNVEAWTLTVKDFTTLRERV